VEAISVKENPYRRVEKIAWATVMTILITGVVIVVAILFYFFEIFRWICAGVAFFIIYAIAQEVFKTFWHEKKRLWDVNHSGENHGKEETSQNSQTG
jgi:divalent metal cation (Fe/Co/Zn/Cd) transporter